jgi:hypothetical protein
MNDRLEKELAKMTPEGRRMWEKVAEEEEQAMMELLEGWDKAGVKKYAGKKKNTGEYPPIFSFPQGRTANLNEARNERSVKIV